tara:strand:- start:571 stop:987 length:417 start_codon:yes stop_codon:yes gene_type:complete
MTNSQTTTFTDEELAKERFDEFLEEGLDALEMKDFIKEHGHKDFALYYEDYARMVDQYNQETVDSFLEVFDMMDVEHLDDAYMGHYESGAKFAEDTVTDGGYIQGDLPYWIAIDWEETWENLSYDYTEANGYIFSNNW